MIFNAFELVGGIQGEQSRAGEEPRYRSGVSTAQGDAGCTYRYTARRTGAVAGNEGSCSSCGAGRRGFEQGVSMGSSLTALE